MNRLPMVLLLLSSLVLLPGCGDPEKKALGLYNQSQVLLRDNRTEEGAAVLDKVVRDYPQTQAATMANALLNQLHAQQGLRELMDAQSGERDALVGAIRAGLDAYRLDCGSYPEDLSALAHSPAGSSCWDGPYIPAPMMDRYLAVSFRIHNDLPEIK